MADTLVRNAAFVVLTGLLSACSTTVERITDPAKLSKLAFLQPGITPKQEVEARFGPPLYVYEKDRVATYRIEPSKDGFRTATGSPSAAYSLVLIYRTDDVLERWSLVDK